MDWMDAVMGVVRAPKQIVDETARHYSGLPSDSKATAGDLISAIAGFKNEGEDNFANKATSFVSDQAMDPTSYLSGAVIKGAANALRGGDRMMKVARWGRPGLQSGDWVMPGRAGLVNWLSSGKFLGTKANQAASLGSGEEFLVRAKDLVLPQTEGWLGKVKGLLLGQRQYVPK